MPHGDDPLPLRRRGEDGLFSLDQVERRWDDLWVGMPAFEMGDADSVKKATIHFRSLEDADKFKEMMGKALWWIPGGQGSAWFGGREADRVEPRDVLWVTRSRFPPRYPVYVPSVGRWENPLTSRALAAIGVPHRVVVEPAQYDDYARVLGEDRLLVLPEDYSASNTGSIPARNWIWEHSLSDGHERHWVIDDNVKGFLRLHRNRRIPVDGPSIFCAAEDFTDRYDNVALSGFNYMYLLKDRQDYWPPFFLNNRVYSMILVNNSLKYRWRGRYNEDTDLSLRALKDGWCTILFNAFLGEKAPTLTMRGGNTDTVYATGDKRRAFAESLVEQHPDVAKVVWRYGRWHHEVDYSRFRRNRLVERAYIPPSDPEYGMELVPTPGRKNRYPQVERVNGSSERGTAEGGGGRIASRGEEGGNRAGGQGGHRRRAPGRIQRLRADNSSPAWRPRS